MFNHLRLHSYYSFLEGLPSPVDLAQAAKVAGKLLARHRKVVTELVPPEYRGAAYALRSVLGFGAGVISPWVFGLVIDWALPGSSLLIVPAVYAREAYGQPFGAPFSRVIRRPRSWAGSDAWDLLGGFTGRLLVVAGENDAVIPPEVTARIYASASRSRERRLMVIPGAGHTPHLEQPQRWAAVLDGFIAERQRGESCRSSGRP